MQVVQDKRKKDIGVKTVDERAVVSIEDELNAVLQQSKFERFALGNSLMPVHLLPEIPVDEVDEE